MNKDLEQEEENIKSAETFLSGLDRTGGFETPPQYFTALHQNIKAKTTAAPGVAKTMSLPGLSWRIASVAAVLLLTLTLFWFFNQPIKEEMLSEDSIIDHLSTEGFSNEWLCEAGWCNEIESLDGIELKTEDSMLLDTELDLLIEEI